MAKKLIKEIRPYVKLYRDTNNGIAWIEDGSTGLGISVHPNLDKSGSVTGMKKLGYWDKSDRIVLSHGWKYNIDRNGNVIDTGNNDFLREQLKELQADLLDMSDKELVECRSLLLERINWCMTAILES